LSARFPLRCLAVVLLGASSLQAAATDDTLVTELLPNGLRVSVLPDPHSEIVATQLWYSVGSAHEEPGSRGLAHLFEHLMFGPTAGYDSQAYDRHHNRHGGSQNAYTSLDYTVYHSQIDPSGHDEVLTMEAQRMRGLLIRQEDLENEQRIVTEELRLSTENDPLARMGVIALSATLGDHPYAITPVGTPEDIAAATVESCRRFYDDYYRPGNAHLVIVGPVEAEPTLALVRRLFGPIPAGGRTPPEIPGLVGRDFPEELVLRESIPPVEAAIVGFALPAAGSADQWPLLLLRQLLTASEIDPFREYLVVDRDKAAEAGIELLQFREAGALIFYSAQLPYRRRATAFRWIDRALARLGRLEWLDSTSLAAAKRALLLEAAQERYYSERRATQIGLAQDSFGDPALALDRDERIRSVTADDVERVFRRYVLDAEPARIYVRPERVPLWIHLFGWLYPLVS